MAKRAARQTFVQRSRGGRTAEQKALYHQVQGAGRSQVKRPFLGLTPDEDRQVGTRIEALIDRAIDRRS
jgi:hypothetical protein